MNNTKQGDFNCDWNFSLIPTVLTAMSDFSVSMEIILFETFAGISIVFLGFSFISIPICITNYAMENYTE